MVIQLNLTAIVLVSIVLYVSHEMLADSKHSGRAFNRNFSRYIGSFQAQIDSIHLPNIYMYLITKKTRWTHTKRFSHKTTLFNILETAKESFLLKNNKKALCLLNKKCLINVCSFGNRFYFVWDKSTQGKPFYNSRLIREITSAVLAKVFELYYLYIIGKNRYCFSSESQE